MSNTPLSYPHRVSLFALLLTLVMFLCAFPVLGNTAQPAAERIEAERFRAQTAQIMAEVPALQLQLRELRENRDDLAVQYNLLSGSQLLHRVLQEQRAALPKPQQFRAQSEVQNLLAELRLRLFYLQREQRQNPTSGALRGEILSVQEKIDALVAYTELRYSLQREVATFAAELEEYLFWTPSNPAMNFTWWQGLPQVLRAQSQRMYGSVQQMLQAVHGAMSWLAGTMLILLLLAVAKRNKLRGQIAQAFAAATPGEPASVRITLPALCKIVVLVAPFSLLLLFLGEFTGPTQADAGSLQVSTVLTALAFAWFMLSLMRTLLNPNGFAEAFLNWQAEKCAHLRSFVQSLKFVVLPLTAVLGFASQQQALFAQDAVGPLALLVAAAAILLLTVWLLSRDAFRENPSALRVIAGLVLLLPLSLMWMVVSGYYYTALQLSGYYLATFYLLVVWLLAAEIMRGAVQSSSAELKLERQAQMNTQTDAPPVDIEIAEPVAELPIDFSDIEKAETQSLRLGRFLLLTLFTFLLAWVWSEAFHTLEYLNSQYIWDSSQGIDAIPVSIGGLLSAVFIIFLSVVLIRNLPGLLEMLVLSRLNLQMGTAYAVTSLTNYVLVSVAVISVLAILGVKWSQLQWLAAGLTVGLGFGLQEIFANFISGLILFFERPVRVGDIVTLNSLSGRVSKIKIRATVITDFDRRDIVVPNRSFITGQFVNWSLSNTITRLTVKVGVAYGSDLDKTREILLDIAKNEPRVLQDPPPQVLFLSFGESTLDHELRYHVGGLSDRNPSIDAINREIDRRFKEAGIEIAFNQLDVHFRNELGVEKLVRSSQEK